MTNQELVKNFLSSEGYKFHVDEDGDIHFKYQGLGFHFQLDERDPLFFRLILPVIYDEKDHPEVSHETLLQVLQDISKDTKVIKIFLVESYVWASIEMFQPDAEHFNEIFERCLDILSKGRERLYTAIVKYTND